MGDKKTYDLDFWPRLTVRAIQQMQDPWVDPDVWKVDGLDRREECNQIVAGARRNGRDKMERPRLRESPCYVKGTT
jgi:5-dehydro-2-deoxygluconokinase